MLSYLYPTHAYLLNIAESSFCRHATRQVQWHCATSVQPELSSAELKDAPLSGSLHLATPSPPLSMAAFARG